ncbi:MAG: Holliday junction resolvase RuvX [Eubacteriales bacterium]|nr:Holliday junction resolvase RuvX [Eubacteriales bacterium]
MKVLGVDYGDARIGVAISDSFGWIASPVETVKNTGNVEKAAIRVKELAEQLGADEIVVGLPRNMNGTLGPRAIKTQEFIDYLKQQVKMDIIQWDERLSTKAANKIMHEAGMKTSKKKGVVDQIAAVHILQGYLDSIQNKNNANTKGENIK